jgi:hypothetical protein
MQRANRARPEASLNGSRSRAEEDLIPKQRRREPGRFDQDGGGHAEHDRGGNPSTGLPRTRVPGSNGSWPARGTAPKPPAIAALYPVIEPDPGEMPEKVFGQYPRSLIRKVLPWLCCERREILHVCSGSLPPGEGIRVDIRPEARPDVLADGRCLPFADGSIVAVLIDPPYTRQYARDLYDVDYPRPSHLLAEAARVVRPCGRIGFVHYLVPIPPPGCRHVKTLGLSTGAGFHMRAVTIFECDQDALPLEAA